MRPRQALTPAPRARASVPGREPAAACLAWLACSPGGCPFYGEAADILLLAARALLSRLLLAGAVR